MIKLGVLQRQQSIKIAHILVRRLLRELVTLHEKAGLVISLDILPKRQAILEIFVFQNGVGANNGRTDKVSAHFLRKGRGKIGGDGAVDFFDTLAGGGILNVQIRIGFIVCILKR